MKYIVILGDGMADEPVGDLNGKTPLMAAEKPTMDGLAKKGLIGLAQTIPEGLAPGSDTANLSVMGYDPKKYYTGRSPLEAISMGVELKDEDISFRCNLVTLSEEEGAYEDRVIKDHGASDISTEESKILIEYLRQKIETSDTRLYPGVSYRHLLVWHEGSTEIALTPPHDIRDQCIQKHLPKGEHEEEILNMMKRSYELLKNHPINQQRKAKGLNPANSIWIWGEGTKPQLPSFENKYGLKGTMISAVDLLRGIAISGGLSVKNVEGATGTIHTNFEGKAMAAVEALKNGQDFVYVHIEAPDECGHAGNLKEKIQSIEYIDKRVVSIIVKEMEKWGEPYKMLITPDHPTPLRICTHTSDPIPFLIYNSQEPSEKSEQSYDEECAKNSGFFIEKGHRLMDYFLAK